MTSTPDPGPAASGFGIDDAAKFLGHAAWLEGRLFEAVGGWVTSTADPALKLVFARQSRRFGWHAELLEPIRPRTRDHDADANSPLDAGWRTMTARLLAATDTEIRVERLREALGHTVACYEEHLAAMRPLRDGPSLRVVGLVLDDDRSQLAEIERSTAPAGGISESSHR
jgi:hypothetical protein